MVLAPQWDPGKEADAQWVAACDDHWATWWEGSDYEFTPEKRLPVFLLATMQPIPVDDHPISRDWLDDNEKWTERNRHLFPEYLPPEGGSN